MVIQELKLPVLRRAPQESRDGKVETRAQTHKFGADKEGYACGASREEEGGRDGDEGVK